MKKWRIGLGLLVVVFLSCKKKNDAQGNLAPHRWMLGQWELKDTLSGRLTESWKAVNDTVFEGLSVYLKDKDTLHLEHIKLEAKADGVYYTAIVRGQNNDQPVAFRQTHVGVFENPKHDYPQKIQYKRTKQGHMQAAISGRQNGRYSREQFVMAKQAD